MAKKELLKSIASEISHFQSIEQKETFLFVLGALASRIITLKKAAEIMETDIDDFLDLLDSVGFEFSYLEPEDILIESSW